MRRGGFNAAIAPTHALMTAHGAQGYPTALINHSPFYGQAAELGGVGVIAGLTRNLHT